MRDINDKQMDHFVSRPPAQLRIGFLPFYVDYYEGICADFPREKMAVARRCAQALESYGTVVWDQQLIKSADSAAAAGRALARGGIDVAVVVTTIAVFASIPWAALRELSAAPILIWNVQQIESVTQGYSMVEIVRNTGQIGTQALANTLLREGRPFKVVTGVEHSAQMRERLRRLFGVVRTALALRSARLLAVGEGFPGMTDIAMDESYLSKHLGASVQRISSAELTRAYVTADSGRVGREQEELSLASGVRDLTADEMERSVRLSVALQSLVDEHGADAGSVNCHMGNCLRNLEIGIAACYSLGVQNSRGRPFTCTGDLPTALAMLLLKNLTGVAMYTEVQVMDEKRQAVVIANSGEGEEQIRHAGARCRVIGNTNFKGVHGRGASFVYSLKPGPATLVSLTPTPNGTKPFRVIVAEGEILDEPLPDAGALAGFFRFRGTTLHDGYTRWLEAGPVHHAATSTGHWAAKIRDVGEMLNFEFVGVN